MIRSRLVWACVFLLAIALGVVGCGKSGSSSSSTGTHIYVADKAQNKITVFTIKTDTGNLSESTGLEIGLSGEPSAIAIRADGKFAFAVEYDTNKIDVLKRDTSSGKLNADLTYTLDGYRPVAVAVDVNSDFVYVAHESSNLEIDSTTTQPNIAIYKTDTDTGALTEVGSPILLPPTTIPIHMTVSPNGSYLYTSVSNGAIYAYSINTTSGTLTAISGSPFSAGTTPGQIAISPDSKFLYVSDNYASRVFGFTINSGALTKIAGSPFSLTFNGITPNNPYGISFDNKSKYLYVAAQTNGYLSAYTVDTTASSSTSTGSGAITPISGSPYVICNNTNGTDACSGKSPQPDYVVNTGEFIYVANRNTGNISAFKLDSDTGKLTVTSSSPFATAGSPVWLAVK